MNPKENRKRKISKRKIKKLFICIAFICFLITGYYFIKYRFFLVAKATNYASNIIEPENISHYQKAEDNNPNYTGIGKERIEGQNGFSSTFSTSSTSPKKYLEYKQNGSSSWSQLPYWDGTMESDGCLITALSVILSGYGYLNTPEDLRNLYYPHLNSKDLSSELQNRFQIASTDFFYDSLHLSSNYLHQHLETNKPILICVWNQPHENRWTTDSHYLVLLATDGNGKFYVSNPNGLEDTKKASGWYDDSEVLPYLAKALFIEE